MAPIVALAPAAGSGFSLSPWPAIVGGCAVIAIMVGGLFGWAATAPLASAVIAQGVVTVDGSRKQVQHLEGGIVDRILVRDGDKVGAGALLLRLDEARARASLGVLQTASDSARALEARLRAERDGTPLEFPDDMMRRAETAPGDMMRAQQVLFEARRSSLDGQQSILRQRIAQHEEEIVGLAAQQAALEKQIGFIESELVDLRELLKKGLVPKSKVMSLEREGARLEGSRGERIADIARARLAIGTTRLELLQLERTFRENVTREYREVQTQIADVEDRLTVARSTLDHIEVRAPVAGTVVGLTAHTEGGVIKPGDVILEIVPAGRRLVVDAQVQPADIDNTTVGMAAETRLSAFKQRTTPTVSGRVIYVSADRLTDSRSGAPYYLARVDMADDELARLNGQALQPGMPAEVLIKRRERTALAYLLQPVTEAFGRAWRED